MTRLDRLRGEGRVTAVPAKPRAPCPAPPSAPSPQLLPQPVGTAVAKEMCRTEMKRCEMPGPGKSRTYLHPFFLMMFPSTTSALQKGRQKP